MENPNNRELFHSVTSFNENLLIYSLCDLHLFLKLFWKRVYEQKISGRERTGRKADGHKDSARIHLVTME